MFSTLLRQQVHLVSSTRLSTPIARQFLSGLPKFVQKPQILPQRAFSISRSLLEEERFQEFPRRDFPRDRRTRRRPARAPATEQRCLYVSNMPFSATEAELRELFEPYGPIRQVLRASEPDGRSSGFGFVEFVNLEDAVAANKSSSEEPFVLGNRDLRISFAHRSSIEPPGEPTPTTTLHIPNFPLPGEEAALRSLFQEYDSHILRINFIKNMEGHYTRKAFIQFTDQATADAALKAFQEYNFEGTILRLSYARNRHPSRTSVMSDFDA